MIQDEAFADYIGYDLGGFTYKGRRYAPDSYDNPIELMENATIDSKRIIDIIGGVQNLVMH